MITNTISEVAEKASARYGFLVESWRAAFNSALTSPAFGTSAARSQVVKSAYAAARAFIASERERIEFEITEIAREARTSAQAVFSTRDAFDLTDELQEHCEAICETLASELTAQIERDISSLRHQLTAATLHVRSSARSQGISIPQAVMQYRFGNSQELRFYFHDRSNRRWPSRRFVRSIWRQHLLETYNDVVLTTAAEFGAREVQIEHADGKAGVHGKRLSLAYNTELPTYSDIKAEIFHPNADAVLAPVRFD